MNVSLTIKSNIAKVLFSTRLVQKKIMEYSQNRYLILMYHRILPINEVSPQIQAGIYVDPRTFSMHLKLLKNYFEVFPLSEGINLLRKNRRTLKQKPVCMLTFDDGWRDFYEYAYPILKEQVVPATVFLPTKFIGTRESFWTDRLAHLVWKRNDGDTLWNPRGDAQSIVHEIERLKGSAESKIERAISTLKNHRYEEINGVLDELSTRWRIDSLPKKRVFLEWEEVREMRNSGLVSFGSHTVNHRILSLLNNDEIKHELVDSREKLVMERAAESTFIPFCYPNGDYNDNIARMVKDAGYQVAVTTGSGWNLGDLNPFCLGRVAIHQDMASSKELFLCRVANLM